MQRSTKPDAFFARKAVSRFSIGVRMRFALRDRRLSIVFRCAVLCTVERKSWTLVKAGTIGFDGYLLVFETTDESVQS